LLLPDDPVFHFGQTQLLIRIPPNSQAVDVLQRGALGDDNPGHLRADINTSGLPVGVMEYLRSTVYDITYTGINKPSRSAKNWKTLCAKAMTL
jgi:hypothetical protein